MLTRCPLIPPAVKLAAARTCAEINTATKELNMTVKDSKPFCENATDLQRDNNTCIWADA